MEFDQLLLSAVKEKICFGSRASDGDSFHIGYGIDDRYARCAAASIASICRNNAQTHFVFHILSTGVSAKNREKLQALADGLQTRICFYELDARIFAELPTQAHFPSSIYYRYLFPVLLDIPRFLYLDADIICMGSIQYLAEFDFAGKLAAVVEDLEWMREKRSRALGLSEHRYFNSGVLLMNLRGWKAAGILKQALELLESQPRKFRYPDQDVLNLLLQGKVSYLERGYNCLDSHTVPVREIYLLHFAAHPKPWDVAWPLSPLCTDFTGNIYRDYEQMTPWRDEPLAMPLHSKAMKIYARCLMKHGRWLQGMQWWLRYIKCKASGR